jgi:hypothetical protein
MQPWAQVGRGRNCRKFNLMFSQRDIIGYCPIYVGIFGAELYLIFNGPI